MMVVDYFVKNIEFNSVMLVIVLSIGIIIFYGSAKTDKKELDQKKQKVTQSILTIVLVLGIITAIIVA
jgi:NhaP-type Na+/H+ or K+/H+ antiporter